jgi:vacuolar protein sorting-associated protein 13A/C
MNDKNPSKFKFSLVLIDSHAIGYRNSICDDGLFLTFSKIGYWFTGIWGNDFDSLIKTGLFIDELEEY